MNSKACVLAVAGFDVSLLAPKDSLAEKSRFVARVAHLHDDTTPMQWVHAFAATVQATSPRLVVSRSTARVHYAAPE